MIKLIDERKTPDITFDSMHASIIEDLKNTDFGCLREQTGRNSGVKADIARSTLLVKALEESWHLVT